MRNENSCCTSWRTLVWFILAGETRPGSEGGRSNTPALAAQTFLLIQTDWLVAVDYLSTRVFRW
jgi:hypothetical protein